VVYDHVAAKEKVSLRMMLHPPAATALDSNWADLRLHLPKAAIRIAAPSRHELRAWERVKSPVDALLPGTSTMQLGPTNKLAEVDLLTVYAVWREGEKRENDYAFKLVESNSAVGARIHRQGLPTLVAFKTDPAAPSASISGFGFNGPVVVDMFRPKKRPR
jgi:hypothetical protein